MEKLKQIRSYEMSLWTLQDSFITVLKPNDLNPKGQIQSPQMSIIDDGTLSLTFKIPMYLRDNGEQIENPIWHNVINSHLMAAMRKIKVIFNKGEIIEKVFEFVIIKITETHEGFTKYCEVECEGLAFNELGKQGYRIYLEGSDEILAAREAWSANPEEQSDHWPEPSINYWCDRVFEDSNWTYSVQMDWSSYDGVVNDHYTVNGVELYGMNYGSFTPEQRDAFNDAREAAGLRRRDKVYEDEYVSSWTEQQDSDTLIPSSVKEVQEKYRLVEEKESNRYNLTQSIAEIFQVFCRYEYKYDDNYHIIGREAIFYNNFIAEVEGIVDLTYKYNTKSLSREMDGADLCSKMFVMSLSDEDMPSGECSIADTDANRSLEDYLLNFDYLYSIGTISEEQYEAIKPFEKELWGLNKQIIEDTNDKIIYGNKLVEAEAKRDEHEQIRNEALEAEKVNAATRANLTNKDNTLSVTNENPKICYLSRGSDGVNRVNISQQGVIPNTLKLYLTYQSATHTLSDQVLGTIENDENGNVARVTHVKIPSGVTVTDGTIYATYSYKPSLWYDNVIKAYQKRAAESDKIYKDNKALAEEYQAKLDTIEARLEENLRHKQQLIVQFERLMGPALREGTWQPEDEYANYGDYHSVNFASLAAAVEDNTVNGCSFIWDDELFDDENKNYVEVGVNLDKSYYPCIMGDNTLLTWLRGKDLSKVGFVFENYYVDDNGNVLNPNDIYTYQIYMMGAELLPVFIRGDGGAIVPCLMITGMETLSDIQIASIMNNKYKPRLAVINFNDGDSTNPIQITNEITFKTTESSHLTWLVPPDKSGSAQPVIVYPRFEIKSKIVKSPYNDILIYAGANRDAFTIIEDYYVLWRDNKYYATIKPQILFGRLTLNEPYNVCYSISNAGLRMYLDAINVLKENSMPKTSYTISVGSINKNLTRDLYNRLGQIAHINDYELKFENVMGYISELNLSLDKPWEDEITIKNYKTKFEDLFSSIVAETEDMKKNSYLFGILSDAFNADGTLTLAAGRNILNSIPSIKVPTAAEAYAQYEPMIRNLLKESFDAAGEVLAAAQVSIDEVNGLAISGAEILGTFVENVAENLTPTSFTTNSNGNRYNPLTEEESAYFKVGDFWQVGNDEYVAIENSSQVTYNSGENVLKSLKGWALTQDSSLAQIKGAAIDINTKTGDINITAQNNINVLSGGSLRLASGTVKITGNQSVEIGGPTIKIYSAQAGETVDLNKGISIFASAIGSSSSGTAAVDITGNGIELNAANGIKLKSGGGIDISSSDGANTSAIKINRTQGIYIGSSLPLQFYSGPVDTSGSSANARISSTEILFGVSNGSSGTAVKMTDGYIVFGAGNAVNGSSSSTVGTQSGLAGVKITKDYIGLATGSGTSRTYLGIDNTGLTASYAGGNGGAIVTLNSGGVLIGTASNKDTMTSNIKANTEVANYEGAKFQVYAPNFVVDEKGLLYARNAYFSGELHSTTGTIGGWTITGTALYATQTTSTGIQGTGLQKQGSGWWAIAVGYTNQNSWVTAPFRVDHEGNMYATSATIEGKITSTEGVIGGWTLGTNLLSAGSGSSYVALSSNTSASTNYAIWAGNATASSAPFRVTRAGALTATNATITGKITSTEGAIGGWTIGSNYIGSGASRGASVVGMSNPSSNNDYAFWAGAPAQSGDSVSTDAKFSVTKGGALIATSATIKGTITADKLLVGGTDVASELDKLLNGNVTDAAEEGGDDTGTSTKRYIVVGYKNNTYIKLLGSDGKKKTVNFSSADRFGSLVLTNTGSVSGGSNVITVSAKNTSGTVLDSKTITVTYSKTSSTGFFNVICGTEVNINMDYESLYTSGKADGRAESFDSVQLNGTSTLSNEDTSASTYAYFINVPVRDGYSHTKTLSPSVDLGSLHTTWYNAGKRAGEAEFTAVGGNLYWFGYSSVPSNLAPGYSKSYQGTMYYK